MPNLNQNGRDSVIQEGLGCSQGVHTFVGMTIDVAPIIKKSGSYVTLDWT